MFPSTSSICALVLVLMCSSAATALNMTNICLLLKNNARIASGDSCSNYYICSNGAATAQSCSSGTYFDKNSQACVSTAPSYCPTNTTNPCTGLATGSFAAVSGSCTNYYYCGANGAEEGTCPNNLVFNPTTQACDYPSNYPCQNSDSSDANAVINLCLYVQKGIYFGNAFSCAGWQKCINESSFTTGSCSNDLVFDTANAICNYPASVDCSQVTKDPNLDVNAASNGTACTTSGELKNATACNQYYQCNNAKWQLITCSTGKYYDTESKTCVNRDVAYNDCDRCLGTNLQFVNAFGTNCTGYLYCSNGVAKSSGTCPTGDYFNEDMGGCVSENPNYVFCTSESSSSTTTTTVSAETTVSDASTATTASTASTASTATATTEATTEATTVASRK